MLRNLKFVRIYSIDFSFYFFSVSVLSVFSPATRKQLVHLEMFSLNFSSLSFVIRDKSKSFKIVINFEIPWDMPLQTMGGSRKFRKRGLRTLTSHPPTPPNENFTFQDMQQ